MWSAVEVAWLAPQVKEQANFWGCERFLPEKFWATLPTNFSLKDHEDLFLR